MEKKLSPLYGTGVENDSALRGYLANQQQRSMINPALAARPHQPPDYRGNVDTGSRPIMSPEQMRQAYPDYEGDYSTLYSGTYNAADYGYNGGDSVVSMTPILADGSRVLNDDQLAQYLEEAAARANMAGYSMLDADRVENGGMGLMLNERRVQPGQSLDDAYDREERYTQLLHTMGDNWERSQGKVPELPMSDALRPDFMRDLRSERLRRGY